MSGGADYSEVVSLNHPGEFAALSPVNGLIDFARVEGGGIDIEVWVNAEHPEQALALATRMVSMVGISVEWQGVEPSDDPDGRWHFTGIVVEVEEPGTL